MLDILSLIQGKKRKTNTGWVIFNGICCHHRGHRPDTRSRAGVLPINNTDWIYHCFNCQFKCGYSLGKKFSNSLKILLSWSGIDEFEIQKLILQNISYSNILDKVNHVNNNINFNFIETSLPESARLVDESDSELNEILRYRKVLNPKYNFYTVDNEPRKRIIVPFYYDKVLVGYTSRFLDNSFPKYVSEVQRGYVFNIDNQNKDWESCILVEGIFDAISIDACAYMTNTISDNQIALLKKLNKKIIVVPDLDKSGLSICDRAIDVGFSVSIPNWGPGIKDANDAVIKYGKLPTILSILESATTSKIKMEVKRKKINVE